MTKTFPEWEGLYKDQEVEDMPWYNPELDHSFVAALKDLQIKDGKVLDVGMGPATQSEQLARLGFEVTGTDISETAVLKATEKYKGQNLSVEFIHDDILNSKLEGQFKIIFDRGCFHVISPEQRSVYLETVCKLLEPSGYLFLKCFSYKEPGEEGPYRIKPEEIRECFSSRFKIIKIEETRFLSNKKPAPHALFCLMQKK